MHCLNAWENVACFTLVPTPAAQSPLPYSNGASATVVVLCATVVDVSTSVVVALASGVVVVASTDAGTLETVSAVLLLSSPPLRRATRNRMTMATGTATPIHSAHFFVLLRLADLASSSSRCCRLARWRSRLAVPTRAQGYRAVNRVGRRPAPTWR